MPDRHGGIRHPKSNCHAMPRLKCQSTLASIRYQITTFRSTDPPPTIKLAQSLLGTNGTFPWQSSLIGQPSQQEGGLAAELAQSARTPALSRIARYRIRKRASPLEDFSKPATSAPGLL